MDRTDRKQLVALALLATLLAPALARAAAPGDLDRSFGMHGKVRTHVGGYDEVHSVAINPHTDRIVAAGDTSPFEGDFAVALYNRDGSLHSSFGLGGKVTTDFGGYDHARAVALVGKGRVVVGGDYTTGGPRNPGLALARYLPNGRLDPAFGSGGVATAPGPVPTAIATDGFFPGQIDVAGGSGGDFALARYRRNGTVDNSFGTGGEVTTDFGGADHANAVAADGVRQVVAGASDGDFALARYGPHGTLDSSFGAGGKVTTDFGSGNDYATSVAVRPRGRIVVAGHTRGGFALARYRPDGMLDPSFSHNGKVRTGFGSPGAGANAVAIDSRRRIVAAGGSGANRCCGSDYALARYRPDGRLDRSFSHNGRVRTHSNYYGAQTEAIDSRDRIVVADGRGAFVLYRYIGYRRR
jgi:uncharacterized delta-60 repeat protein